jgi:thioredoxin-related protein
MEYIAEHYWDNFNFNDTTLIHNATYTEQGFVDFIGFLDYLKTPVAQQAMETMMSKAAANKTTFNYFATSADHYLYDPHSPYKNDELYIPVLQSIVSSPLFDDLEKTRPRYLLNLELKNRPGRPATDFVYTLKNGQQHRMYDIKADYTILFFNYPDCPGCKLVKENIVNAPFVSKLGRRLVILAVYPNDDGHLQMWKSATYPSFMINSYDKKTTVLNKNLYDLKASPTIYLLDKNKNVILKNTGLEQINKYFIKSLQ